MPIKHQGNSGHQHSDGDRDRRIQRAAEGEDIPLTKDQQRDLEAQRIDLEAGRQQGGD